MLSVTVIALFVLYSALLIGKILMHFFPDSGFELPALSGSGTPATPDGGEE